MRTCSMSIFQGVAKNCLFGTAEPELRTSLGLLEEKPKPNLNQIRENVELPLPI